MFISAVNVFISAVVGLVNVGVHGTGSLLEPRVVSGGTAVLRTSVSASLVNTADLQRELDSNDLRAARTAAVQFAEEKQRPRIQQRTAPCVYDQHMLQSDEWSVQRHAVQTPQTDHQFIPVNQESHLQPPNALLGSDVFQLAPFKTPGKESRMAFSGAASSACRKPAEAADVFLRAPFGKRQETTNAVPAHTSKSGAQQMHASEQCHLVGVSSPPASQPLSVRAAPLLTETPLLQQPVAVHRVVSRIGQQAAVGSVAVGPLHSWTIGGRSLDDPFTAAPFQPRCSQGKP